MCPLTAYPLTWHMGHKTVPIKVSETSACFLETRDRAKHARRCGRPRRRKGEPGPGGPGLRGNRTPCILTQNGSKLRLGTVLTVISITCPFLTVLHAVPPRGQFLGDLPTASTPSDTLFFWCRERRGYRKNPRGNGARGSRDPACPREAGARIL